MLFPRVISPKVNVLARLDFEIAYYDVSVQPVNHYTNALNKGVNASVLFSVVVK